MKSFEQRTFFLPAFTSRACLIASMAEIFIARRDGIHAETKTVNTATVTATATACHETEKLMPNGASSTDLNKSPQSHSVIPIPPMPTRRPIGMPHTHSANASKRTDRLIWLRVAPIEASKPNCFVLSLTEIENAL